MESYIHPSPDQLSPFLRGPNQAQIQDFRSGSNKIRQLGELLQFLGRKTSQVIVNWYQNIESVCWIDGGLAVVVTLLWFPMLRFVSRPPYPHPSPDAYDISN